MWPTSLKDWVETCAYFVGAVAAVLSVWQYHRNSAHGRVRWLFDMYQRFHGDPELRKIRIRLDEGDTNFIREETDLEALGLLDDYLNFFEFLAFLHGRKEIKRDEMLKMFDYPLQRLAGNKDVVTYIAKYGYEETQKLLAGLKNAS